MSKLRIAGDKEAARQLITDGVIRRYYVVTDRGVPEAWKSNGLRHLVFDATVSPDHPDFWVAACPSLRLADQVAAALNVREAP